MMKHQLLSCPCKFLTIFSLILLLFPILVSSKNYCTCETESQNQKNISEALRYKFIAIASILLASAVGVSLPFLAKNISYLRPDGEAFSLVKAFAAGVILATGFIHILPDAFETLSSPCLGENPWKKFPFTGLVAMLSAIGTLMMESFASGYHKRSELRKPQPVMSGDDDDDHDGANEISHIHGSAFALDRINSSELVRHRIISQVKYNKNMSHILVYVVEYFFDMITTSIVGEFFSTERPYPPKKFCFFPNI